MRVTIRLLGAFSVEIDDLVVAGDGLTRRDPIRLAAYLALAPDRRAHREQVIDALWPDAQFATVGNRLHKAAHFLRAALGQADAVVLSGSTVALFPRAEVVIDAVEFESAARRALIGRSHDQIAQALALYRGDLLPHELYDEWTFAPRQRLQLRSRELLHAAQDYQRLVAVDPTDEDAHLGLMRQMLRVGDRAGVRLQFEALSRILHDELGVSPSPEARAIAALARGAQRTSPEPSPGAPASSAQQVGFCTTEDGVRLAYATSGTGPPLVKAANWLTHLDHDWASPVWGPWWQALSGQNTLIRYDERGCGLSDWEVDAESFTLESWVRDLETVVDNLGLERFALLGMSQGGPIAITYAARHPDRVSHLIVFGTCARSTWARADETRRQELAALGELLKVSWGSAHPGFRQVYDAKFLPDGPLELWRAFDELQRRSTSARNAYRLWRAFGSLDASEAARNLQAPTLILHSADDQVWSFDEAQDLHAITPNSRLVRLESRNHILTAGEPAFAEFIEHVTQFLAT